MKMIGLNVDMPDADFRLLQTFLVDRDNRVLEVGDPAVNPHKIIDDTILIAKFAYETV